MPLPTELVEYLIKYAPFDSFVETGTFKGKTAEWASHRFRKVITIEKHTQLFNLASTILKPRGNVTQLLGDSGEVLKNIVEKLTGSSLFWLDAHWSGEGTSGEKSECPVLAEINALSELSFEHLILIDDARLFCFPPPYPHDPLQWPNITELIDALRSGRSQRAIYIWNDIVIAIPMGLSHLFLNFCRVKKNSPQSNPYSRTLHEIKHIAQSILMRPRRALGAIQQYYKYKRSVNSLSVNLKDINLQLADSTKTTPFDPHYLYQSVWAFSLIRTYQPQLHIDIGSEIQFVSLLSLVCKVAFVDIRRVEIDLVEFNNICSDILTLPFRSESVESLSCLHVIEHIGLGRYGDRLDPNGTVNACRELSRVLKVGGNLFLSLPIGAPRVCFNAHRIHSIEQVQSFFPDLQLHQLSVVDDDGRLHRLIDYSNAPQCLYGCGLFWFRKSRSKGNSNH